MGSALRQRAHDAMRVELTQAAFDLILEHGFDRLTAEDLALVRTIVDLAQILGRRVVAEGDPGRIITADLVESVYGLKCEVIADPQTGTPLVIPAARAARR